MPHINPAARIRFLIQLFVPDIRASLAWGSRGICEAHENKVGNSEINIGCPSAVYQSVEQKDGVPWTGSMEYDISVEN